MHVCYGERAPLPLTWWLTRFWHGVQPTRAQCRRPKMGVAGGAVRFVSPPILPYMVVAILVGKDTTNTGSPKTWTIKGRRCADLPWFSWPKEFPHIKGIYIGTFEYPESFEMWEIMCVRYFNSPNIARNPILCWSSEHRQIQHKKIIRGVLHTPDY